MSNSLVDYLLFGRWVDGKGGAVFPTRASAEWFIRHNRKELVESGELILRRGSAGSLIGPGFSAKALEILLRQSRESIGRVA